MECNKFKKNILNYFLRIETDWKLQYEIEDHLLECENCQKIYSLLSLVTNKKIMSDPLRKVYVENIMSQANDLVLKGDTNEAIKCLERAMENFLDYGQPNALIKELHSKIKKQNVRKKISEVLDRLINLENLGGISLNVYSFDAARSQKSEIESYRIGERIYLTIDIPDNIKGYLILLRYSDVSNYSIVYPKSFGDENYVIGGEKKIIEFDVEPPAGTTSFMAILTNRQLTDIGSDDSFDSFSVNSLLESLSKNISKIDNKAIKKAVTLIKIVAD